MNFFNLQGKTALITGASSGLGERFAHLFAEAGVRVILAARRSNLIHKISEDITKKGGKVVPLTLDVADKKAVNAAVAKLTATGEKIDILINNAGIARLTPLFEEKDTDEFESVVNTNLLGVWYVTKAVAMHMKNFNIPGTIINIGSVYGLDRLEPKQAAYCASKAAVIQMTKALVGELSEHQIRINCIAPGYFLTPMVPPWVEMMAEDGKIECLIPQKYLAAPSDLDGMILFLASNVASRYVTGSCFVIDGGLSWGGGRAQRIGIDKM